MNDTLRPQILSAVEHQISPECYVVGDQHHYILSIGDEENAAKFCFSFLEADGQWYFQHMENIFIRLDQIGTAPVSTFPDISEEQKAWAREEIQVSEKVRLYNILADEKGKEFAFNCFRDGTGYFVGARAWVPFVKPDKAFILYTCWDLANLQGNQIILLSIGDKQAIIKGQLRYFELYQRAGHLRQQIIYEDYFRLFETIWQDRARCAGWNLQINIDHLDVTFNFQKLYEQ